jgi:acetoin utilization protein AcuB
MTNEAVAPRRTTDRVRDVMSAPVSTLRDQDPAWQALVRFAETGFRHLVVLDDDGRLVGVLDDRRVLSQWPLDAMSMHRQMVGQLVWPLHGGPDRPPRLHPDQPVAAAAALMLRFAIDALPVVDDDGAVVGIVTGSDLVRSMVQTAAARAAEAQDPEPTGTRQTATVPPPGPA